MQLLCFIVLLLTPLVFGQTPVVKYAGTTVGSATITPPTLSSGSCTAGTTPAPYVQFNYTFTAGVYEVAAMAENAFKSALSIYIYTAPVTVATPCSNLYLARELDEPYLSGGPVLDDYVYFSAATYFFVVTGSGGNDGIFAVNIFASTATGKTNATSPTWPSAYSTSSDDCTTSGGANPYAYYSWTQATTGNFDILGYFYNETITSWSYTYVNLYNGTQSNISNGLLDPCNSTATGGFWMGGEYNSGKTINVAYVPLVAGVNYTLVISGDDSDEYGYWGLQVIPTRVRFPYGTEFDQPSRGVSTCTTGGTTSFAWSPTVFTAEQNFYLLDTQNVPSPFSYFDTYSFMYQGLNAGNTAVNPPVAPATCPAGIPLVSAGDTGDVTPVFAQTQIGLNYTVIVSSYSSQSSPLGPLYAYSIYLFTGNLIGTLPSVPTATTTTTSGGVTGATGGTGATTSKTTTTGPAGNTTTTTSKATGATSTSSSASKVAAAGFVVAAVLASFL